LINTRLAAAFEVIPVAERSAEKLALAAYRVMEGAALALGLPSTGVAFFKPGAHPDIIDGFVVEWLDGPTIWACAAAPFIDSPQVSVYPSEDYRALEFFAVRS
jgi:hypothetical protein